MLHVILTTGVWWALSLTGCYWLFKPVDKVTPISLPKDEEPNYFGGTLWH